MIKIIINRNNDDNNNNNNNNNILSMTYFQKNKNVRVLPQPVWNKNGDPIQYNTTLNNVVDSDTSRVLSVIPPVPYNTYNNPQLVIRKGQVCITSIASGFPTKIDIRVDGMNGYLN